MQRLREGPVLLCDDSNDGTGRATVLAVCALMWLRWWEQQQAYDWLAHQRRLTSHSSVMRLPALCGIRPWWRCIRSWKKRKLDTHMEAGTHFRNEEEVVAVLGMPVGAPQGEVTDLSGEERKELEQLRRRQLDPLRVSEADRTEQESWLRPPEAQSSHEMAQASMLDSANAEREPLSPASAAGHSGPLLSEEVQRNFVEVLDNIWTRYENAGVLDDQSALEHLVTSLLFRLQLRISPQRVDAVLGQVGAMQELRWDKAAFSEWFTKELL